MWAIVPVKQFDLAKERLTGVLSAAERHALARAMLGDVLEQLALSTGIERTLVVTREPEVAALARGAGAHIITEPGSGLNSAVATGVRAAIAAGAHGALIVHGDLPLARAADFEALLAAHAPGRAATLAPDELRDGTNCLLCTPPDLIPFRFGADSFTAHCAEIRMQGLEPTIVERMGLATDVDHLEDLQRVCSVQAPGRAVAFLHGSGIASRIRDATAAAADAREH